jgi:hypothetical protein
MLFAISLLCKCEQRSLEPSVLAGLVSRAELSGTANPTLAIGSTGSRAGAASAEDRADALMGFGIYSAYMFVRRPPLWGLGNDADRMGFTAAWFGVMTKVGSGTGADFLAEAQYL